ncbi:F-box protein [Sesbania bispinosa]|nr:F-box protein [Sesbania bispinosa]
MVGSSSLEDLFNAKMCCKHFMEAGDEDLVYKQATVERLGVRIEPLWVTTENQKEFLDRCRKSGNVDVMYREGMMQYFKGMDIEAGLQNLRRAAMTLHAEARYLEIKSSLNVLQTLVEMVFHATLAMLIMK